MNGKLEFLDRFSIEPKPYVGVLPSEYDGVVVYMAYVAVDGICHEPIAFFRDEGKSQK